MYDSEINRIWIILLAMTVFITSQAVFAADEIRWSSPITSTDGSTTIRLSPLIEDGIYNKRKIGFFSSDGTLRRVVQTHHSFEYYGMSTDGYFGVIGVEVIGEVITGDTIFLYCPLGHLIWKAERGKKPLQLAISENGNYVAVNMRYPTQDGGKDGLEIFDVNGKLLRKISPSLISVKLGFLDGDTLLIASAEGICAIDVKTGTEVWKTEIKFDLWRGQYMAVSSDGAIILIVDFIRSKRGADVYLSPRMRLFRSRTGELITEKIFDARNSEKVPDYFRINNDAKQRRFSIEGLADVTISYK